MKIKLLLFLFLPIIGFSQTQLGSQINNPDENNVKPSKFGTGVSVSSDGTIVAVGAPGNNENSFVRVFKYVNNDWQQLGADIVNESVLEKVGHSVSLSADGLTIAIGAPEAGDLDEGHVRIYQYNNNTWEKIGNDIVGDGTQFYLGYKVVLTPGAKFLAASAYKTNSSKKGAVKVYENISGTWTQKGTNLEGEFNYDAFGFTIDLSDDGSVLAVSNKGRKKVQIYKFENNDWVQIGADFTGLTLPTVSLSADGSKASIGSSTGISIYNNNNGVWELLGAKISFGNYASISSLGDKIAVGSPDDYTVKNYIFQNNSWSQRGVDVKTWRTSQFGESIALSSDGETFIAASPVAFPRVYTFNSVLSVSKYELTTNTHIYPNPVVDTVTISFNNNNSLKKATIYTLQGKKVLESVAKNINVSKLTKGIYIIDIETTKGTISKKIFKK